MQGLVRFVNLLYRAQEHEGAFRLMSPRNCITASEVEDICGPIEWSDRSVLDTLVRWKLTYEPKSGILRGIRRRKHTALPDRVPMEWDSDQSRNSDQSFMQEEPLHNSGESSIDTLVYSVPSLVVTPRDPTTPPPVRKLVCSNLPQPTAEPPASAPAKPTPVIMMVSRPRKNVIMSDESESESESSDSDESETDSTELETFGYSDFLSVEQVERISFQGKAYWPLVRTISFLTSSQATNDNAAARRIMGDLPNKFKTTKVHNMYVIDTTKVIALRNCLSKRKMLDSKAWSKFCKVNNIQSAIRTSK